MLEIINAIANDNRTTRKRKNEIKNGSSTNEDDRKRANVNANRKTRDRRETLTNS